MMKRWSWKKETKDERKEKGKDGLSIIISMKLYVFMSKMGKSKR